MDMENMPTTPVKEETIHQSNETILDCKTPIQDDQENDPKSQVSCNCLKMNCTPDPLKVPKAFKYPERYRSPTDAMVSPVTKGILARNRRAAALLPPSLNHSKVQETQQGQGVVSFKIEI